MAEPENDAGGDAGGEVVEGYIVQTQSTLGQLISKPRLLPERLRKPPFRFLFDIAVEVARVTGFGLAEIFGGELAEKPQMPGTREDKVAFLERWIAAVIQKLEGQPVQLDQVSPDSIVSGTDPEWTSYLLQCTAVAAWSGRPAEPELAAAGETTAETPAPAAGDEAEAPAPTAEGAATVAAAEAADLRPVAPRLSAEEQARAEAEATAAAAAAVAAAAAAAEAPDVLPPWEVPVYESPPIDEDQLKAMAEGMDFASALQGFTGAGWNKNPGAGGPLEASDEDAAGQESDPDEPPAAELQQPLSQEPPRPKTAGQVPLQQAAMKAARISEEIQRAQELLDQMDEALEKDDAILQKQREAGAQLRLAKDAEKQAVLQAELDRIAAEEEADGQKKAMKAEAKARKKEEREQAKARLEALKKEAEGEAAALAAQQNFPRSKTSQAQGARMVAAYDKEDEYEWDGDPPQGEGGGGARESPVAPADADDEEAEAAGESESAFQDPMSACFTDAILGDAPPPKPLFPGMLPLDGAVALSPSASEPALPPTGHPWLFDRLKAELKDSFISFLSASMPSSLLKKYNPDDLIACLQFLLQELRKCLADHNLEDVHDEEPTSLAEDLRQNFPNDWLTHLQGASPWALRSKYDLPELVDTMQGLTQVCSDRLSDELGILAMWCSESSPLRSPVAPISPSPTEEPPPNLEEALPDKEDSPRPRSAAFAPAPWAGPAVAAAPSFSAEPPRLGTSAGFAGRAPPPAPSFSAAPAPVFSTALGPALWEQEAMGLPVTAGPRTAGPAPRIATGMVSRGGPPRPPMTASRGVGFTSAGR